ncbi:MAG: HIT family protein [Propionibacteriaceae bacterium]
MTQTESVGDLIGVPDAFDRLWVPHRMAYIDGARNSGCPFCEGPQRDDKTALIIYRGEHCFVAMNLYPYSPGHVLVMPYHHVPLYTDLTLEETAEFALLTQQAMRVLAAVSHPAGFNLGINQGAVAGAGIAGHLHQHVVPRWRGDMNFFPIIAQTKAMPQLLEDARIQLSEAWNEHAHDSLELEC